MTWQELAKQPHQRKPRMDRSHPQWEEFIERLAGSEGCNFRIAELWEEAHDPETFDCDETFSIAEKVLAKYDVEINSSIEYFEDLGASCSCSLVLEFGSTEFWSH
jgi:hypothetical protein